MKRQILFFRTFVKAARYSYNCRLVFEAVTTVSLLSTPQVLYRMEAHWLSANEFLLGMFKSDILAHLVQITTWHSAAERTRKGAIQ